MDAQVLTISSKGQISIPVSIRRKLSLETGDKLIAFTTGDSILLKTLAMPEAEEFEASLEEAEAWAKSVGYGEKDVDDIIHFVRQGKRK